MVVAHSQLDTKWLGRLGYAEAVAILESHREALIADNAAAGTVFFCEHEPVITLGKSAKESDLLQKKEWFDSRGIEVVSTSRGGEITCHGPGQLMVYPVVRLKNGVVPFLRSTAVGLGKFLAGYGVTAAWKREPAGLWVADRKIASCGLHIKRQVTIHGFALNIGMEKSTDTLSADSLWSSIRPCGMSAENITSLRKECARSFNPGRDAVPTVEAAARLAGPLVVSSMLDTSVPTETSEQGNIS